MRDHFHLLLPVKDFFKFSLELLYLLDSIRRDQNCDSLKSFLANAYACLNDLESG